jgi:hypothetical protein
MYLTPPSSSDSSLVGEDELEDVVDDSEDVLSSWFFDNNGVAIVLQFK